MNRRGKIRTRASERTREYRTVISLYERTAKGDLIAWRLEKWFILTKCEAAFENRGKIPFCCTPFCKGSQYLEVSSCVQDREALKFILKSEIEIAIDFNFSRKFRVS